MCWKGVRGCQGWSSNEHPITIELIKQWNILGEKCGFIYSDDDRPIPEHLVKLQEAIESSRKYFKENPPKEDDTIKDVEIKNPKFEIRENASYLIGGDIIFKNGAIIGKVDKINTFSIGYTGTKGAE